MASLYFYYSAMNAGKSTSLLQSAHNYRECGMDVLLFLPEIDNRYGHGKISTRIGLEAEAVVVDRFFDVFSHTKEQLSGNVNVKCVLVDEAQFLTREQVNQLALITEELNIPVLAYGLRSDFRADPFEGSQFLLAWADVLTEIKTVCHCGRKAIMNLRIDGEGNAVHDGEQVEIGGNERYVATCRKHFRLGQASAQESLPSFAQEKESIS